MTVPAIQQAIRPVARWGLCLLILAWPGRDAIASHKAGHCRPPPASAHFPLDFPHVQDAEWGYGIGGWGGISNGYPLPRHPVIFVHGNTRDAVDWDEPGSSVKRRFLDAGYSLQELWALSYNGRSTADLPLTLQCHTDNHTNIPDLVAFIGAVRDYTGAEKVDIVAHSLGVTIVRGMLAQHPGLATIVEDFVAIAGPNHGTTVCRRLWLMWIIGWKEFMGCDELRPGSAWLRRLNGSSGDLEIRGPTRYLSLYDGTGTDILYLPWLFWWPVRDQESPALRGATNIPLPGLTHDELRTHEKAVAIYLRFLLQ